MSLTSEQLHVDGVQVQTSIHAGNDADGETVQSISDNCRIDANPTQTDSNHDGCGDACSPSPSVPMQCELNNNGCGTNPTIFEGDDFVAMSGAWVNGWGRRSGHFSRRAKEPQAS